MNGSLQLWSPPGVVLRAADQRRATRRLSALGFEVRAGAVRRAGAARAEPDDEGALLALHRVAATSPRVALASASGQGLARLLDGIDWRLLARSVARGTRWVGHGELTLLQLGLLAHAAAGSWSGPMAGPDFGAAPGPGDDAARVSQECFAEAMDGSLEAVGFRTVPGFDGLACRGLLWGGHLPSVLALLGTRHWPSQAARGGVLLLDGIESCGSLRLEQGLLQLRHAGVLQAQRAVLLGVAERGRRQVADRGLPWATVLARARQGLKTPLLSGLPAGAGQPRLSLPLGRRVQLQVQGRDVLIAW